MLRLCLIRNAYNMVINKFGDRLYNGLVETETAHLRQIAAKVEAAQGEGFLKELKLRWEHHNKSMQMVRDILMVSCLDGPRLQRSLPQRNIRCRFLCNTHPVLYQEQEMAFESCLFLGCKKKNGLVWYGGNIMALYDSGPLERLLCMKINLAGALNKYQQTVLAPACMQDAVCAVCSTWIAST